MSEDLDQAALTAAHKAVEDVLIEHRDGGIGLLGYANGFVVKYPDGKPSDIMRLSTRQGLAIGIQAYLAAIGNQGNTPEQ